MFTLFGRRLHPGRSLSWTLKDAFCFMHECIFSYCVTISTIIFAYPWQMHCSQLWQDVCFTATPLKMILFGYFCMGEFFCSIINILKILNI